MLFSLASAVPTLVSAKAPAAPASIKVAIDLEIFINLSPGLVFDVQIRIDGKITANAGYV
jgi:hypothetical protein